MKYSENMIVHLERHTKTDYMLIYLERIVS